MGEGGGGPGRGRNACGDLGGVGGVERGGGVCVEGVVDVGSVGGLGGGEGERMRGLGGNVEGKREARSKVKIEDRRGWWVEVMGELLWLKWCVRGWDVSEEVGV